MSNKNIPNAVDRGTRYMAQDGPLAGRTPNELLEFYGIGLTKDELEEKISRAGGLGLAFMIGYAAGKYESEPADELPEPDLNEVKLAVDDVRNRIADAT